MRRLLLRPGALGDCILSLPVLKYLAAEYTEVWAPSAVWPLYSFANATRSLAGSGIDRLGVGDLLPDETLVAQLRQFDSIVSWYGANRPEFRETVRRLDLPFQFHAALPPGHSTQHATDFWAQQVGAPYGLQPSLHPGWNGLRQSVVIHPFSGSTRKNWPLAKYRQLAASLRWDAEWCAGPNESLPEAVRFDGIGELAQWLRGARLYIGNDSGLTHLAAAVGCPVLALFGPTDPRVWAPRGAHVHVTRWEPIQDLAVEPILQESRRLLASL